jgi:hypothetical protein
MFGDADVFGWLFGLPRVRVAVAVVAVVAKPGASRYLMVYNQKWRGYSFPMKKIRVGPTNDPLRDRRVAVDTARDALRADLEPPLGLSTEGRWIDRIEVEGTSGRTGQPRIYEYDIVEVSPTSEIPDGSFASRHGYLTADEIRHSDPTERGPRARLVTWTTWQVLTRLLDNQQVAVAVVRRGDLYLMTRNRYGQWFFPARRMGDGRTAWQVVVNDFRAWNINLRMEPGREELVALKQPTTHLGTREYRFHLQRVNVDVEGLAAELTARSVLHQWRPLEMEGDDTSPTLAGLRDAVRKL